MTRGRIWISIFIAGITAASCNNGNQGPKADSIAMRQQFAESPVLSPAQSLEHLQIEDGIAAQLVASEPQVVVPVAMTFDERGRMWVAEMTGYMPDTTGSGEDARDGRIVILEDADNDGTIDTRTVFLDSLILPRALCIVGNGLLVAEPPKLWYVEMNGDKAGKKTLVDSAYAEGGNVEHQPNGLYRAMDNWIYNAKSSARYRYENGRWLKEETHFRGQWGLSQDNYGRLFYNNNSENLLGDYFPAGLGSANPNQRRVAGYDENIVPDNRTYPIRPTPGVNRGYMKDVLDDSLRLVNFTAACGPLIYRGGAFGEAFEGNAFVAEPSANLIKRNILKDSAYIVKGHQAYTGKEFIASTDERFRPVNLHLGPDGAMYVLDMYRGIIQHKTYLTPYLKNEIGMRSLTQPLNCGRIYRIYPKGSKPEITKLSRNTADLVKALGSKNGWIRDKAQQMLVDAQDTSAAPLLRALIKNAPYSIASLHAVWALEGLHVVTADDVEAAFDKKGNPAVNYSLMAVFPSLLQNEKDYTRVQHLMEELSGMEAYAPMTAYLLPALHKRNAAAADAILQKIYQAFPGNPYVADAVISNAANKETQLLADITAWNADTTLLVRRRLERVINDIKNRRQARMNGALAKEYPRGNLIFKTVCQTCHGMDGDGIKSLAPPLNHSEIVTGKKERLISIVLFGLTGPVEVNGKVYKAPEYNADMPGIANNDEFSDADIAQLLSFVRNSWSNKAEKVTEKDIQAVRQLHKGRQKSFTMEELK